MFLPSNRLDRWLATLLLVYVVLAVWYSLVIPLGEAPDEVDHFRVIRYVGQHRHLPTTEEEHEAVQPPLYYLIATCLTFWIPDHVPFAVLANADFDLDDPSAPRNLLLHPTVEDWPFRGWVLAWRLARLLSVAFGTVTVWAVFRLGHEIFIRQPEIGLAMAALTAFTPQFLFTSAVVTNDNAATAFSALVLWQAASLLRRPSLQAPRLAWLGVSLGLGLLSKTNTLALVPVVGLVILIVWSADRAQGVVALLRATVLTLGLAALIAGWYFVRNVVVFGDPLGFAFVLATNPLREGPLTLGLLVEVFQGLSRSFWLGWIGIELDAWVYGVIYALCMGSLVGFASWLVLRWRQISPYIRWTVILLGMHAAVTLASLIRWTALVRGTGQGRLIYPLLPTVMLILVGGLLIWLRPSARRWAAGSLTVAWLVLALVTPGRYLNPVYRPASHVDELPAGTNPVGIGFGDSIRLVGYRLDHDQVRPGKKLSLHLYWQATAQPQADIWSLIELVDATGTFLMYKDGSPSAGRDTTDRWTPGRLVASEHRLAVPDYGEPGTYWLTLRLHPASERTWLPVTDAAGIPLGDTFTFDEVVEIVAPREGDPVWREAAPGSTSGG
jgi:hypothetical protein